MLLGFPLNRMKKSAVEDNEPIWSELCSDLLSRLIFPRLSFIDQLSFRGVCKAWRSAGWIINNDTNLLQTPLWLMRPKTPKISTSLYEFTDTTTDMSFTIDIPELEGCSILTARSGWLLARGPTITSPNISSFPVFFLNPFTHHKLSIPDFVIPKGKRGPADHIWIELTSPPNSPDCVIFAIAASSRSSKSIWTSTYRQGEASWAEQHHEVKAPNIDMSCLFVTVENIGAFQRPEVGVSWPNCRFNYNPFNNTGKVEPNENADPSSEWWPCPESAEINSKIMQEGKCAEGFCVYGRKKDNDEKLWSWKPINPAPAGAKLWTGRSSGEVWIRPRWATSPFD